MGELARCGPWAVVAGASDGIGEAFVRGLAGFGCNVVLVARRAPLLDEVAASITRDFGVETRSVAVDLTAADAVPTIVDATRDLDVGSLVHAAGGDANHGPFLSQPVDHAVAMVERNCVAPLRLCHHFGAAMRDRGRGAIVLVSSGAALVGGPNMVAYGATKAFDMVMAEALWAELHTSGVAVVGAVLGLTDTPSLRRTMVERGQLRDVDTPVPGAAQPDAVVEEVLAHLDDGPTLYPTDDVREGAKLFATMTRNDAARAMVQLAGDTMGHDEETSR
jgi:uncharacterized protein